jgi:hypothetical protein
MEDTLRSIAPSHVCIRGRLGCDRRFAFAGSRGHSTMVPFAHVSSDNSKVRDYTGKELSFLLAPSFDRIFSTDGKTTYQMKNIKPGRAVKIVYHQQLRIRFADRIIFLTP